MSCKRNVNMHALRAVRIWIFGAQSFAFDVAWCFSFTLTPDCGYSASTNALGTQPSVPLFWIVLKVLMKMLQWSRCEDLVLLSGEGTRTELQMAAGETRSGSWICVVRGARPECLSWSDESGWYWASVHQYSQLLALHITAHLVNNKETSNINRHLNHWTVSANWSPDLPPHFQPSSVEEQK